MNETDIAWLNGLEPQCADEQLRRCCGSKAWCKAMVHHRPFADVQQLHDTADSVMNELSGNDWLEAFACHPPIGNLESLRMKYSGNREWSSVEQSGVAKADEQQLLKLEKSNVEYQSKFGFTFIVCATGKSAHEMLLILTHRIKLNSKEELINASMEQRKITHLRIDKLEKN